MLAIEINLSGESYYLSCFGGLIGFSRNFRAPAVSPSLSDVPRVCTFRRFKFSRRAAANRFSRSCFVSAMILIEFTVRLVSNPTTIKSSVAFLATTHLQQALPYGKRSPTPNVFTICCRSSGVEHSLGKGEAESSILSGSTIKITVNSVSC